MNAEQTAEQSLTHHVALVIDNDYDMYQERLAIVRAFLASDDAQYPHLLGDQLKDWAEGIAGLERDDLPLLATEMISTALAWVDWRKLAEDYIEEAREVQVLVLPDNLREQLEGAHGRYAMAQSDAELARRGVRSLMLRAREAGATNQEIGNALGVSRQRVSQILRKQD